MAPEYGKLESCDLTSMSTISKAALIVDFRLISLRLA